MNKKSLFFKTIYFKIWKSPVQAFTKTLAKVFDQFYADYNLDCTL